MANDGAVMEDFGDVQLVVFDFDGVFTDNTVVVDQLGRESVSCWRSDGLGLSRLSEIGVQTFVLSTETNSVVGMRARKLNVPFRQGVSDKASEFLRICAESGVEPQYAMFVGNDINDIPALKLAGYPVAVADAYPEIKPYASVTTMRPGGRGAVREICDKVYRAREGLKGE